MPKAEDSKDEDSTPEGSKPEGSLLESSKLGHLKTGVSKTGTVGSCFLLFLLLALCWFWGWQIGATALADPDTCWLLAVGKWICAHGIPASDPFSWTAKSYAGQYLPYQWLASICFYQLYNCFGAGSLLFLVSYSVLLSFFILPLFMARRLGLSLLAQAVLTVLAISAGSFHFPLRPELFSYLLISLLSVTLTTIVFFHGSGATPSSEAASSSFSSSSSSSSFHSSMKPISPPLAFVIGLLLFLFWANLHSGFVIGLTIVIILLAVSAAAKAALPGKLTASGSVKALCMMLAGAILGSLATPFQFRLYAYLPDLFFSPMNKYNQELLPLSLPTLLSSDYLPFFMLQTVFFAQLIYLLTASIRSRSQNMYIPAAIAFGLIGAVLFVASDLCRRLVPFAVLFCFPYFWAWSKSVASSSAGKKIPLPLPFNRLDSAFARLIAGRKGFIAFVLLSILFMGLGTNASATQFPAAIPQTTFTFDVPLRAVEFIQATRPHGNMLNDPQFGDVLIFNQGEKARVFIDTRFDLYGAKFCHDYFVMANCLDGYENLMRQYQIDWIFFPHRAPITTKLAKDLLWKTVYQDNAAVIMVKQK